MSTKKVKYYERDMFSDESNNRDSLLKRTTNGKNDFIENENELSNYLQEDMLHPNEKGVEIIVQAILPTFIDFIESFSEK